MIDSLTMEGCVVKHLIGLAVLAALGGCAVDQPMRGPYGNTAMAQPRDPSQWRVVSVTPVPSGTAAQVAAKSADGKPVEFSSTAVSAIPAAYLPAPVYVATPVYVQEPAYYWPPVALSLGFGFGRGWGDGRHWGGGHVGGHFRHR